MTKYLFGAFFGVVLIAGIGFVAYWGIQPRPVEKISPSVFQNSTVVANSILLRMRQELSEASVLIWGLDAGNADQRQVLQDFMNLAPSQGLGFQATVLDSHLEEIAPDMKKWVGDRIDTAVEMQRLSASLKVFAQNKARTIVILPTSYAAAMLQMSPARKLREQGIVTMNLFFSSFPRVREQEKDMLIPCNVPEHDSAGTGALGCQIVGTARVIYRKHFAPGSLVGLLNQIGQNDYLFLLTREP